MSEFRVVGATSTCLLASIGAVGVSNAAEAEQVHSLAPVVVMATRSAKGIDADLIGSSVSVLQLEDLSQRQTRVVTDILRDIPGISVGRSGAAGNFTQVRVRGAEANHVLFLIDGVEVSDPFTGEFDFATLLSDEVARIEVLRGQQSALYGSDAIAGVINYITPTGRDVSGASLRIEGGSMGTIGAAARLGGATDKADFALSATYQHSDGYPTSTQGTRHIGSDIGSVSARGNYDLSDAVKLSAGLRYTRTDADTNAQDYLTGHVVDTPGAHGDIRSLYADISAHYRPLGSAWAHSVSAQHVSAQRDDYNLSGRTGGGEGTRSKASYVLSYEREAGQLLHRFNAAVDIERETFQNTAPYSPWGADITKRSTRTLGLVAQYDLSKDRDWGMGLALRHDDNNRFDNATTHRLHGFYNVSPILRLRAAAGSGIKNPGQTEMFGYNASAYPFVGNPDLRPERSEGWEVGADIQAGRTEWAVTYFNAELKDEIYGVYDAPPSACATPVDPTPTSCSTTGNRDTASHQQGVEVSFAAQLAEWARLNASYTYLDAVENGVQEIRRPPHIASANLTFHSPSRRGQVTATLRYNGRSSDTDFVAYPARNVSLSSFVLFNLAGSWKVNERVEVFGRVENLFGEQYQEVLNYRGAPRAAYAGFRVRY